MGGCVDYHAFIGGESKATKALFDLTHTPCHQLSMGNPQNPPPSTVTQNALCCHVSNVMYLGQVKATSRMPKPLRRL
jgi:hypothetical protein